MDEIDGDLEFSARGGSAWAERFLKFEISNLGIGTMSIKKNNNEALRWLRTAQEDLKAAKVLVDNHKYSHSCFLCQQAAEKAVKAVHYSMDSDPWGHSAKNLISSLSQKNTIIYDKLHMMQDKAMILDRFYIPSRYPNGLPDLIPSEAYNKEDAEKAFKLASLIVDKCGEIISA